MRIRRSRGGRRGRSVEWGRGMQPLQSAMAVTAMGRAGVGHRGTRAVVMTQLRRGEWGLLRGRGRGEGGTGGGGAGVGMGVR